ncbi:MAG: sporulation initiation factor Spo0A C-terminal domain-containing protein [Clostridiales bacterium]|nr:sporulation initiation factor Spo0A C-terminal domain-containing protein [Clostridiales bacterium]
MVNIIYDFLIDEGISSNVIGFRHIMNAIEILCAEKEWKFGGEGGIYDRIAKKQDKGYGWRTIERSCRYANSKAKRYSEMTMKEWLVWIAVEVKAKC